MVGSVVAQTVPDLTTGGVPSTGNSVNFGPTGMRGWVFSVRQDSRLSRQIMVYNVDAGSPADGILAPDDVIPGASGTAAAPVNFTSDARMATTSAPERDIGHTGTFFNYLWAPLGGASGGARTPPPSPSPTPPWPACCPPPACCAAGRA